MMADANELSTRDRKLAVWRKPWIPEFLMAPNLPSNPMESLYDVK
jgi:hypothetical protein